MKAFLNSNQSQRQVLVVDDEIINRELLAAILSQNYAVSSAENGQEAMELLCDPEQEFSLILTDLHMPVMDGYAVIEHCKADERLRKIPIIVMTTEKTAEVKSIRMGAADFIAKPYDMPEVILARCERIIELSEDRSIIRSTERDSLTNLYSREFFFAYVRRLITHVEKDMDALALNIDRFNLVNELFGRAEGNRILKKTAELITGVLLDSNGIACRMESDIFYVYCEHRTDYEPLIKQIQKELAATTQARGIRLRAGICECVDNSVLPESWFDRAKTACDRIRGRYDRHIEYYSKELYERFVFHERLIGDVQEAIDHGHMTVFYQPKYDIRGDKPVLASAEALVRWNHPKYGMISPGEFIPLFERNGLIRKVDRFVWREAAAQIRRWMDLYGISLPVSVNVSRIDVFDPELEDYLTGILSEHNLSPSMLMPEITESAYADNGDRLIEVINRLRERGFRIEMDDFGTGYSSLNMLTAIPIDVLKLDMKFIRYMLTDEKSLRLVELVIDIARFLDVPLVAEGVEYEEQLRLLKQMGCDYIQGYYFSKPLSGEEFEKLLQKEGENK